MPRVDPKAFRKIVEDEKGRFKYDRIRSFCSTPFLRPMKTIRWKIGKTLFPETNNEVPKPQALIHTYQLLCINYYWPQTMQVSLKFMWQSWNHPVIPPLKSRGVSSYIRGETSESFVEIQVSTAEIQGGVVEGDMVLIDTSLSYPWTSTWGHCL